MPEEDWAVTWLEEMGRAGLNAMIRFDAERLPARNVWTVVVSGKPMGEHAVRTDNADLGTAVLFADERVRELTGIAPRTEAPSLEETVRLFVATLVEARAALLQGCPALDRFEDILEACVSGRLPMSGTFNSGIGYQKHGIGCALTTAAGHVVDVDFFSDGGFMTEGFDATRLGWFVDSHPGWQRPHYPGYFDVACDDLVAQGFLRELKRGWYAAA